MTTHGDFTPTSRWKNYGITHGRTREIWVTDDDMERIREGVSAGTIEVRDIRDKAGTISQWRAVTP